MIQIMDGLKVRVFHSLWLQLRIAEKLDFGVDYIEGDGRSNPRYGF